MKGIDQITPAGREVGVQALLDHVRAGKPLAEIYDAYPGLDFSGLEASVKALVKSASTYERPRLHFQLALLRSLRYAVASSKYCLALGAANGIRELYEGQRLSPEPEP